MNRWFRTYDDIINDPKILLLPEAMRWFWLAFPCIASKNDGILPAIEIIAISPRVTPAKTSEYLNGFVTAGLIDEVDSRFVPHNAGIK